MVNIDMILAGDFENWRTWRESAVVWRELRRIAAQYGWIANGSIPVDEWDWDEHAPTMYFCGEARKWKEPPGPWNGDYESGHVIPSDATALADALERHLATLDPLPAPPGEQLTDLAKIEVRSRGWRRRVLERLGLLREEPLDWQLVDWSKVDWDTHRNHYRLSRFLWFCRESGGFQIYKIR